MLLSESEIDQRMREWYRESAAYELRSIRERSYHGDVRPLLRRFRDYCLNAAIPINTLGTNERELETAERGGILCEAMFCLEILRLTRRRISERYPRLVWHMGAQFLIEPNSSTMRRFGEAMRGVSTVRIRAHYLQEIQRLLRDVAGRYTDIGATHVEMSEYKR